MTKGDLVCHWHRGELSGGYNMLGVILEEVRDQLAMHNKVFTVVWQDGTVGNNVWDYDLKVMNESR